MARCKPGRVPLIEHNFQRNYSAPQPSVVVLYEFTGCRCDASIRRSVLRFIPGGYGKRKASKIISEVIGCAVFQGEAERSAHNTFMGSFRIEPRAKVAVWGSVAKSMMCAIMNSLLSRSVENCFEGEPCPPRFIRRSKTQSFTVSTTTRTCWNATNPSAKVSAIPF